MQPRISMITALDTDGNVWFSLLQANSNSEVMGMFFSHFIMMLDVERPGWRKETVILLDNAPYHQSSTTMAFFKEHQVPVMFTGPHSFDASPIELLFAAFKRADINPQQFKLGKK